MQIGRLAKQMHAFSSNRYHHQNTGPLTDQNRKQRTIQMICALRNTFENKHVTLKWTLTGMPACCAHRNVSVFLECAMEKKLNTASCKHLNDKLEYS